MKMAILKKDVSFAEDVWKSISEEAQDFVSSLLRKTPAKRPTAKEALTHQFIKRNYQCNDLLKADPELRLKIHDGIKKFISYSVFKKVILQMIARRYPAKEILDLTHIFTDIDITRRGTISFGEFKGLFVEFSYKDTELRSMFNLIVSIGNHFFSHLKILNNLFLVYIYRNTGVKPHWEYFVYRVFGLYT
jgi:serine/threonine protein kinase